MSQNRNAGPGASGKLMIAIVKTPLGYLGISISNAGVSSVDYLGTGLRSSSVKEELPLRVVRQIRKYFKSPKHEFDLPLDLAGTPFQKKVWRKLQKIPVGQTCTYGQLAKQLGTASQAVGNACRANPVPIIIPCHRVVSANGLGGYMGKTKGRSTDIKQWLLNHERH